MDELTILHRFLGNIFASDSWLDDKVSQEYKAQPLAQDWARVSKVIEELGEAIAELILYTGQNPRKGTIPESYDQMLNELADVACTGILAIQHFEKDSVDVWQRVVTRMQRITDRIQATV